ncbi:MAG: hypothetical protein GY845_25850 [Planctomycetes bacterium]|nr:hypothetical protein [Planctomycetota bacterium]
MTTNNLNLGGFLNQQPLQPQQQQAPAAVDPIGQINEFIRNTKRSGRKPKFPDGRGMYVLNAVNLKLDQQGNNQLIEFIFTCIQTDGTQNGPVLSYEYQWAAWFQQRFGGNIWSDLSQIAQPICGWSDDEFNAQKMTPEGQQTLIDVVTRLTGVNWNVQAPAQPRQETAPLNNVLAFGVSVNSVERQKKANGTPMFDAQGQKIMTTATYVNFDACYSADAVQEAINNNTLQEGVVHNAYGGADNFNTALAQIRQQQQQ